MPYTLFGEPTPADAETPERRLYGVAVAKVESNRDLRGEGRVQLSFPWAPGINPWARVAAPYAGMNRGMYFMPQEGDEVLVAFQNGDIRSPYVIGALWSPIDRPPIAPGDILAPSTKRIIRTGSTAAHEIVFDDVAQSIMITSLTQHQITMDLAGIKLSTAGGLASIALDAAGSISIKGAVSIELQAQSISISGADVSVTGSASTSINGGANCSIQATTVRIN